MIRVAAAAGNDSTSPGAGRGFDPIDARGKPAVVPVIARLAGCRDDARRGLAASAAGRGAAELVISPATARTHVSRSMTRLRARDRGQLVVFAYQSGLVRPAP